MKCLVKGCNNHSAGGKFFGELCLPCHEMLCTGIVHPKNPTFIGDLKRETTEIISVMDEIDRIRKKTRHG